MIRKKFNDFGGCCFLCFWVGLFVCPGTRLCNVIAARNVTHSGLCRPGYIPGAVWLVKKDVPLTI